MVKKLVETRVCDICALSQDAGEPWQTATTKFPAFPTQATLKHDICKACSVALEKGDFALTAAVFHRGESTMTPEERAFVEREVAPKPVAMRSGSREGWLEDENGKLSHANGRVEKRSPEEGIWVGILASGGEKRFGHAKGQAMKWVERGAANRRVHQPREEYLADTKARRLEGLKSAAARVAEKRGKLAENEFFSK